MEKICSHNEFSWHIQRKEEEEIERALKIFMLSGIFSQFNPENEEKM